MAETATASLSAHSGTAMKLEQAEALASFREQAFSPVPPLLERYELLSLLGRGGMGVVYRARDRASGEEVAWETIKNKLLEIIANEDKSEPLSDEDLVTKLSEAGYPVARRTVTKYRKMLKIASSRQRKVWQ